MTKIISIKIESGVPMPPKRPPNILYPFAEMQTWDVNSANWCQDASVYVSTADKARAACKLLTEWNVK